MKRSALIVIVLAMLVIGAGYLSAFLPGGAPRLATYAFAVATAGVMTAISVLGAARRGRGLGALRWVFLFTFLVLAGGFAAALSSIGEATTLWLGLPRGAAIIIYVVGLVPMAVLPLAYALTFERTTLSEPEMDELRRKLNELNR
jgi:hypothetical protein